MKKHLQKITALLILTIAATTPAPAAAVWGVGDISLDPIQDASGIAQTILDIQSGILEAQTVLKEFGLDVAVYKVSQQLSQKLINKVLNKANGGSDGVDKLFIENFGKYFQDIANQQVTVYTNELANSASPFAQSIVSGISNQVGGFSNSGLNSFSLDKVLPEGVSWQEASKNISAAGNKGWDFYGQLAFPQNSPLGASMIAQDELANKIKSAKQAAQTELTSTGILPDKAKGEVGKFLNEIGSEAFSGINLDGKIKSAAVVNQIQQGQAIIESFDRLRNADGFGKILFGTIQQLSEGLIKKGFSSLYSDGGTTARPYGGPQDLTKVLNSGGSWASTPQQVVELRKNLATDIEKTTIEIGLLEETITKIREPINNRVVYDLEYCVPGPDTRWETRLREYQEAATKDTSERAAQDGGKGSNNSAALIIVRRQTQQAILEARSLINNPFLNIPGAAEMKSVLREYYKQASQFKTLFDSIIVKRQVLTNLQTVKAEAIALGRAANNPNVDPNTPPSNIDPVTGKIIFGSGAEEEGVPLILFEDQWNKLSQAEKTALYTDAAPALKSFFPEYLDPANPDNLKPLEPANPDLDMMNRVLDQQWDTWETIVPEKSKQNIYAKYISMSRDISDSSSAQRAQVTLDAMNTINQELSRVLIDCNSIKNYVVQPNANANDTAFIRTLASGRIARAFSGPSILSAVESGINFSALNERIVKEEASLPGINGTTWSETSYYGRRIRSGNVANRLQVPELAKTPAEIISQDLKQELFCRLTIYHLYFWAPSPTDASLTGEPIGCGLIKPEWVDNETGLQMIFNNVLDIVDLPQATTERFHIVQIRSDGVRGENKKRVVANWYHTNNADILFAIDMVD